MTDAIDQAGRTLEPRPPNRWLRPIVRWLVAVLLLSLVPLLCRLGWFWYLSEPSRQIEIGRATTYLDGPLTPDGYVDYVAAVNQQISAGVTPENNAVVLLVRAFGPHKIPDSIRDEYFRLLGVPSPPDEGNYFVNQEEFVQQRNPGAKRNWEQEQALKEQLNDAMKEPWTRDQFPDVAAMLDLNAESLDVIVEASRRERYYSPQVPTDLFARMMTAILPVEQELYYTHRQLLARAMLTLGEGNPIAASQQLLACHRLARQISESPSLLILQMSIEIDNKAIRCDGCLADDPDMTAEHLLAFINDLNALKKRRTTVDILDGPARMLILDTVTGVARCPQDRQGFGPPRSGLSILNGAINWNIPLAKVNEEFDLMVTALRGPDELQRRAFFDNQHQRLAEGGERASHGSMQLRAFFGQREEASRRMADTLLSLFTPAVLPTYNWERGALATERVIGTGLALVVHKLEHGAYPETLHDLVPDVLSEVPVDPWSGDALGYRRTDDGCLVYSVTSDLVDDGGLARDEEAGRYTGDEVLALPNDYRTDSQSPNSSRAHPVEPQ